MYKFKLPIGDWSGDGHSVCDWYIIESNYTIEYIVEMYLQACEKLGFSLDGHGKGAPCSEYQDYVFPKETTQALLDFGVILDEEYIKCLLEFESTDGSYVFAEIILALIRTQNPELILKIVEDDIPILKHYDPKSKKSIGFFGYGLFD